MFPVGIVLFTEGYIPFLLVKVGEEGICLLWRVVYFCQAEAVGQGQSLCIDARSADDIDILFL